MSVVRFYVRNEDGSIEGDETCVNDRRNISEIVKGFTVLGQHKEFVLEFDPPLFVPAAAQSDEEKLLRKADRTLAYANAVAGGWAADRVSFNRGWDAAMRRIAALRGVEDD